MSRFSSPSGRADRRWLAIALLVALIAIAAAAAGLANGFTFDDRAIIVDDPRIHTLRGSWRLFASTYWPPRFGASLYRPLTTFGFALQWTVGGGAAWIFHLTSVLLYAAVCVALLALFTELLPLAGAAAGAALFAAHPVHVEAVANIVGQSELLVALLLVRAVTHYLRARRDGGVPSPATAARIATLFALALLAKEHAIVLPLLLVAAEWLVVRDTRRARARARALLPLGALLGAVVAGYLVVRVAVVGSLVGEQSFVAMAMPTRVWTFFGVASEWARLLVWPARLSADYSPPGLAIVYAPDRSLLPGFVLVIAFVATLMLARRRARVVAFALAWVAIALAPVSNLVAVTGILLAERTLFLPSVGAMLAAGWLVARAASGRIVGAAAPTGSIAAGAVGNRIGSSPVTSGAHPGVRPGTRAIWGLASLLIVAGVVRSAGRSRVWRDDATLFAQTAEDAPAGYRAQYLYGRSLFEQGRRAAGERQLRRAIHLEGDAADADALNYLATQYRTAGLCAPALPLYRDAVARAPRRPDARYGLAACLLATGDIAGARAEAERGLAEAMGLGSMFRAVIASADSTSADSARVDGARRTTSGHAR